MALPLLIKMIGRMPHQETTWEALKPMMSFSITESVMIGSRRLHPRNIVIQDFTLSRRHARIVIRENQWHVQDLRSENGSWLLETDKPRVNLIEPTLITQDMIVLMGALVVQFDLISIDFPIPDIL